jgi:hypothetical protein
VFEQAGRFAGAAEDYRVVVDASDDQDARTRLEFCLARV